MERLSCVLAFISVFSLASCAQPTKEDRRRLGELRRRFQERCHFRFELDGLYVVAECRSDLTHEEAKRIYEAFWMTDGNPRSDSSYVYLNVYDKGSFRFQVYWDPKERKLSFSQAEHY